jgi:hypothetical protein
MGFAWPDPRFVDNEDGTLTDKLTGLMWEAAPDTGTYTWANAFDVRIAALNTGTPLGGHTDWRLPNDLELLTLYNPGSAYSASGNQNLSWLTTQGFSMVLDGSLTNCWTSTSQASGTTGAWLVSLNRGNTYSNAAKTEDDVKVIGVRGGQ